jgi:hypothetical protein
MNKSVIARTALESDCRSSYARLDDQHWYSVAEPTNFDLSSAVASKNGRLNPLYQIGGPRPAQLALELLF